MGRVRPRRYLGTIVGCLLAALLWYALGIGSVLLKTLVCFGALLASHLVIDRWLYDLLLAPGGTDGSAAPVSAPCAGCGEPVVVERGIALCAKCRRPVHERCRDADGLCSGCASDNEASPAG